MAIGLISWRRQRDDYSKTICYDKRFDVADIKVEGDFDAAEKKAREVIGCGDHMTFTFFGHGRGKGRLRNLWLVQIQSEEPSDWNEQQMIDDGWRETDRWPDLPETE